jgi:hypothetical protein
MSATNESAAQKIADRMEAATKEMIVRFEHHYPEGLQDDDQFVDYLSICFPKLFAQAVRACSKRAREESGDYGTAHVLDYMLTARYEELKFHRLKSNNE